MKTKSAEPKDLTEMQTQKIQDLANVVDGLIIANKSVVTDDLSKRAQNSIQASIHLLGMLRRALNACTNRESESDEALADVNVLAGSIIALNLHGEGADVDTMGYANQGLFRLAWFVLADIVGDDVQRGAKAA
jgi:hypothetical protein